MTFLPIVSRELRLASRRRGTYWLRSGAALGMMIAGAWLFLILRGEPPKELAMALFCVLTGGAVVFALLSGPRSTADAISEEKREGTLGLLFLTDLRGYDVVFGKLVAGSLNAFYSVVSILPMIAIPLLLAGGITLSEIGRMALVTVNALFFSLAVSMWISSMSHSAQKSAALSSLLIILLTAGSPAFGALVAALHKASTVNPAFLAPSVGFGYYLAFATAYSKEKAWFWISLGLVHSIAWLSLLAASLITPASWKDRAVGTSKFGWREVWAKWSYGSPSQRALLRQRLLEVNPLFWLTARVRGKMFGVWMFLGVVVVIWCAGWLRFRKDWLNEGMYLSTAALVNLAFRYWFAGETTRAFADQRKTGALELLLSTPITIQNILLGLSLGLKRQFLGPVLVVLIIECLFMFASGRDAVPDEERLFWFSLWVAGMLMFVADFVALFWIGLWTGLTARNPLRAMGATLTRVLILPWIAYAAILALIILTQLGPRLYHPSPSWQFFLGLWFLLGIGTDIFFGLWAWNRLNKDLRLAAQETYSARTGIWNQLLGGLQRPASNLSRPQFGSSVDG